MSESSVTIHPWQALRRLTHARIALGRTGVSQPSAAQLAFGLAHAQARDAVHAELAQDSILAQCAELLPQAVGLHSAAGSRHQYLQRPDLGRRLAATSLHNLQALATAPCDLAIVIGDGLSARAVEKHAAPLLRALLARLAADAECADWRLAPLCLVSGARVAIGDEIGAVLQARCVVVLIGERPGLSSPESMGLYLSWAPRPGLSDAERNCISNIHTAGLSYQAAALKAHYLLAQAQRRGYSGVALKEASAATTSLDTARPFLLADQATKTVK